MPSLLGDTMILGRNLFCSIHFISETIITSLGCIKRPHKHIFK